MRQLRDDLGYIQPLPGVNSLAQVYILTRAGVEHARQFITNPVLFEAGYETSPARWSAVRQQHHLLCQQWCTAVAADPACHVVGVASSRILNLAHHGQGEAGYKIPDASLLIRENHDGPVERIAIEMQTHVRSSFDVQYMFDRYDRMFADENRQFDRLYLVSQSQRVLDNYERVSRGIVGSFRYDPVDKKPRLRHGEGRRLSNETQARLSFVNCAGLARRFPSFAIDARSDRHD